MIDKRYLEEASRIRESYLKTLDKIIEHEQFINKYKDEIEKIMETNTELIEENPEKPLNQFKNEIKEDLLTIDSNINKIVSKLEPLLTYIEKLQKESKELYITIKDKYPSLTENDIQLQVFDYIKR